MYKDNMITRETLVARANGAQNKIRFYKSYVKNIMLVKQHEIPGHVCGNVEQDFYFEYKGKDMLYVSIFSPIKTGK